MAKPRKRNQTLTVRLTEQEKERIQTQAKKARRSVTDYLVALSWETPICLGPDTRPLLVELKRMGSNVNQIAQKVNAGAFTSYNFQEVVDQLGALHEALCRLIYGGQSREYLTDFWLTEAADSGKIQDIEFKTFEKDIFDECEKIFR